MSNEETQATEATSSITGDTPNATDDTQVVTASAPVAASNRARPVRKTRVGVVTSNGMDKTAVVSVVDRVRHPKYNKFVLQTKKLYAHDETNDVNVGDRVRVMETRPLSKTKRWRVVEVLERAR